jgi:hypothetical protein
MATGSISSRCGPRVITAISFTTRRSTRKGPREIVCRRVRDLDRLGWTRRCEEGFLIATDPAARDLAPTTEAAMRHLTTIVAAGNEATFD